MDFSPYIQLGIGGLALILMFKIMMTMMEANRLLATAIDKNTQSTDELYTYIRTRNGTLERIALADPKVKKAVKAMVKDTHKE